MIGTVDESLMPQSTTAYVNDGFVYKLFKCMLIVGIDSEAHEDVPCAASTRIHFLAGFEAKEKRRIFDVCRPLKRKAN